MDFKLMGSAVLRLAIRRNLVSFPSQVPMLMGRGRRDNAERVALLYFVRGWPLRKICDRYGLNKAVALKLLAQWRIRAVAAGYIQDIDPETLEALARASEQPAYAEERLTISFSEMIAEAEMMFDSNEPGRTDEPAFCSESALAATQKL